MSTEEAPEVTLADMLATGATYRKIDYWARAGWLGTQGHGSGRARKWTVRDRDIAALIVRLTHPDVGLTTAAAARAAVLLVDSGATTYATEDGITFAVRPQRPREDV